MSDFITLRCKTKKNNMDVIKIDFSCITNVLKLEREKKFSF